MSLKVFALVLVLAVLSAARHVHPRRNQWSDMEEELIVTSNNDRDSTDTEIKNIAPKKLSPRHSILFFKYYDPCDQGFELDYQGICREVWF